MLIKSVSRGFCVISKRFLSSDQFISKKHYDIVVAGGGMIGTTLACTLGKNPRLSNKSILLLESGKEIKKELSPDYSNRVSSLNPATFNLLNDIGAWQHIANARFKAVKRMQVWDAISDAVITFDRNNLEEPVAYVVENDVLLAAVQKEIINLKTVEVVYGSKLQSCSQDSPDGLVNVNLENGSKYTCNLLLGCDGANSQVRKSMGFHYISYNYKHSGIVATLKLSEDVENVTAWQRHLPNSGFLAFLPLSGDLSSLVWSTNEEEARKLMKLTEEEFINAINEALWKVYPRSGIIDQATKSFDNLIRFFNLPSSSDVQMPPKITGCDLKSRAKFPLGLGHATNYVGKGVALVGDAAHRIHPLAGQGVNLGFGDVICLNKILGEVVYSGGKIGSLDYLKKYETERQQFNVPMLLVVHGLFQLYSTQFTPVVLLRSLGLQATHAISPLKKCLISQASGIPVW